MRQEEAELNKEFAEGSHTWHSGVNVTYDCNPCFSGEPVMTCDLTGVWVRSAGSKDCRQVGCGPAPEVAKAVPELRMPNNMKDLCWTSGMNLTYQCRPGYDGLPLAMCTDSGRWQMLAGSECRSMGCGSLAKHLGTQMALLEPLGGYNVSAASHDEDVVRFRCKAGFTGKPVAMCLRQTWTVVGACVPYATSLGCSCRTTWSECDRWPWSTCREHSGCADGAGGRQYRWCEVSTGSCPASSGDPSWDYCSDSTFQDDMAPVPPRAHRSDSSWNASSWAGAIAFLVVLVTCGAVAAVVLRRRHCARQARQRIETSAEGG